MDMRPIVEALQKRTVGGPFTISRKPALRIHHASLKHDETGAQIIHVTGWYSDGTPFAHITAPFQGDPVVRADRLAQALIAAHNGDTMPAPAQIKALGGTLREQLAKAVERANQINTNAVSEVANLHTVLDSAEETIRDVKSAAADIQSALGLTTNGGPSVDPT